VKLSRPPNIFLMPTCAPPPDSSLAAVQDAMARALMRPLAARERMQPGNRAVASAIIRPNDRLTSFQRLQIYNQQYWWRLFGAFAADFPGLRAVLGKRKFQRLAVAYLNACGSTSWNLRDLGQHLESFLRAHPEHAAPYSDLALDVVRVEWARVVAFDGDERPSLDPQSIAGRVPSRIRLDLQPYLSLLTLDHPIDGLLRRLKRANASNTRSGRARVRPLRLDTPRADAPICLAVHRLGFSVYYKRLEPEAYRLLGLLREGARLESACTQAFEGSPGSPENAARRVAAWFAEWMQFGWICERAFSIRQVKRTGEMQRMDNERGCCAIARR
jgi:hypothetical protein